jgi:hypothetical protein
MSPAELLSTQLSVGAFSFGWGIFFINIADRAGAMMAFPLRKATPSSTSHPIASGKRSKKSCPCRLQVVSQQL